MLTKKQILKDLPYKTIPACEVAYKNLFKNVFEFEGIDAEELEKIKACITMIFFSMRHDSINQISRTLKTPARISSFYSYKAGNYEKMYDFLTN